MWENKLIFVLTFGLEVSTQFRTNSLRDWPKKIGDAFIMRLPKYEYLLIKLLWSYVVLWPLIYRSVPAHFITNSLLDWLKIWRMHYLWISSGMIYFWPMNCPLWDSLIWLAWIRLIWPPTIYWSLVGRAVFAYSKAYNMSHWFQAWQVLSEWDSSVLINV